uniref:Uncharacterized protein n=1 Tax=Opuntia streptacantha TaxID=393608 RepID=A0A7C9D1F3_OPUST
MAYSFIWEILQRSKSWHRSSAPRSVMPYLAGELTDCKTWEKSLRTNSPLVELANTTGRPPTTAVHEHRCQHFNAVAVLHQPLTHIPRFLPPLAGRQTCRSP